MFKHALEKFINKTINREQFFIDYQEMYDYVQEFVFPYGMTVTFEYYEYELEENGSDIYLLGYVEVID
jgi:hypothetical protein